MATSLTRTRSMSTTKTSPRTWSCPSDRRNLTMSLSPKEANPGRRRAKSGALTSRSTGVAVASSVKIKICSLQLVSLDPFWATSRSTTKLTNASLRRTSAIRSSKMRGGNATRSSSKTSRIGTSRWEGALRIEAARVAAILRPISAHLTLMWTMITTIVRRTHWWGWLQKLDQNLRSVLLKDWGEKVWWSKKKLMRRWKKRMT